jgi:hypothetical protein
VRFVGIGPDEATGLGTRQLDVSTCMRRTQRLGSSHQQKMGEVNESRYEGQRLTQCSNAMMRRSRPEDQASLAVKPKLGGRNEVRTYGENGIYSVV